MDNYPINEDFLERFYALNDIELIDAMRLRAKHKDKRLPCCGHFNTAHWCGIGFCANCDCMGSNPPQIQKDKL